MNGTYTIFSIVENPVQKFFSAITEKLLKAIDENDETWWAIFTDLPKTFHWIDHNILIAKLCIWISIWIWKANNKIYLFLAQQVSAKSQNLLYGLFVQSDTFRYFWSLHFRVVIIWYLYMMYFLTLIWVGILGVRFVVRGRV